RARVRPHGQRERTRAMLLAVGAVVRVPEQRPGVLLGTGDDGVELRLFGGRRRLLGRRDVLLEHVLRARHDWQVRSSAARDAMPGEPDLLWQFPGGRL